MEPGVNLPFIFLKSKQKRMENPCVFLFMQTGFPHKNVENVNI